MNVVKEVKNVTLKILEGVSQKNGKTYQKLVCNVNGVDVNICFIDVYLENTLLKAKVL